VLHVRKVTPTPEIREAVQKYMSTVKPLVYRFDDPRIIITPLQANETYINRDGLTYGNMPKKIVVAMLDTQAYNGQSDLNPFNFQHFNVSSIAL